MISIHSFDKRFSFDPGSVHVFLVTLDQNRTQLGTYKEYLSIDEKQKADRFKFGIDQERFIVSRAILRILSGFFLKMDPKQIQFTYGEQGKPDYAAAQRLNFNLTHSGDMIALGFIKDHEIGIDIELVKNDFDVMDIASNFFSVDEIASLKTFYSDTQNSAFYRCWTRKESFIKAKGSGLSFPLDAFTVSLDTDERPKLLETKWNPSEKDTWNLFSFTPKDDYIGALAVQREITKVNYWNWNDLIKNVGF